MGLFGPRKITPAVAANKCALMAIQDYGALCNALWAFEKIDKVDLIPAYMVYLKMVCTIMLKQASQVLPDADKNEFGRAFRAGLESPLHGARDSGESQATLEQLNSEWYRGLTDNIDYPLTTLASVTVHDMLPVLPLHINDEEEAYIRHFVETRARLLSEGTLKFHFAL